MLIDLFAPFRIKKMAMPNRFMRSATFDRSADNTGAVTEASVAIYEALGRGGIGLIVTGFAFISENGQAGPLQYGVHNDSMVPGLRRLVKTAHDGGAKIALQIVHSGININPQLAQEKGFKAMVVSPIPEVDKPQRQMTEEDIQTVIGQYVAASLRAREAGFDAVQFHGAHGYGISQFLSPRFNHRADQWGGSPENRQRFPVEVTRAVRKAVGPDFPVLIKLGAMDDGGDGLTLAEGIEDAKELVKAGMDSVEVSAGAGGGAIQPMKEGEHERAYFRERTKAVKRAIAAPVALVGGVRSMALAQEIIDSGDADLISMSRPFIREPGLIARWQRAEMEAALCISCSKCLGRTGDFGCKEEERLAQKP